MSGDRNNPFWAIPWTRAAAVTWMADEVAGRNRSVVRHEGSGFEPPLPVRSRRRLRSRRRAELAQDGGDMVVDGA